MPSLTPRVQQHLTHLISLLVTIVVPTILRIVQARAFYVKEPYHTSILSGEGWVQELLNGHPKRIRCELGVTKHVFEQLIQELRAMGYTRSKFVSLEEQLAIFLYTCVTGLTTRHAGERFQRSNATISKFVSLFFLDEMSLPILSHQILQTDGQDFFIPTILYKTCLPTCILQ
jgi:uncharacterized phage protein gp47/JayE